MTEQHRMRLPQGSNLTVVPQSKSYNVSVGNNETTRTIRDLLKKHHVSAVPLREPAMLLHDHMPHVSSQKSVYEFTSHLMSPAVI